MPGSVAYAFVRQAGEILGRYPDLVHRWEEDNRSRSLVFPASEATGFDVRASVSEQEIVVFAKGAHRHFDSSAGSDAEAVASQALGLIRDLLSPGMRVREFSAGRSAYRWAMEIATPNGWKTEE